MKDTGEPASLAHMINGSEPTLSLVAEREGAVADAGKVMGTGTLQELPFDETVTPVMDLRSLE